MSKMLILSNFQQMMIPWGRESFVTKVSHRADFENVIFRNGQFSEHLTTPQKTQKIRLNPVFRRSQEVKTVVPSR